MLLTSLPVLLLSLTSQILTLPISPPIPTSDISKRSISTGYYNPNSILSQSRNVKKDVFMSRGWGAGGMPFSVLYMSPPSSRAPVSVNDVQTKPPATVPRAREHRVRSQMAVRNSMGGNVRGGRKNYSIIPQLFVSYGWGPAGK